MKVLAVGDVVGQDAAAWLVGRLPALRDEHQVDVVVVNAENAVVSGPSPWTGFGMSVAVVEALIAAGADVITGGNHSWDGAEVDEVLEHPRVLRPANLDETRGRGVLSVGGLSVVNLLSPTAALPGMKAPAPRELWSSWGVIGGGLRGPVLIDLHGESPWEKALFASALDGQVSVLVGTHTHDPTLRGRVLPAGTGYVAELGMTGRDGFTGGGFNPAPMVAALRGDDIEPHLPYQLASGPFVLGAVLITLEQDGRTRAIERIT